MVATMTQNPLHFNRTLAGARGLTMRARERDALAAQREIQRRGSERGKSEQQGQDMLEERDEDATPRRRRSQRRRSTTSRNIEEREKHDEQVEEREKHDEQVVAELTSAIEHTDDIRRSSTDD
ncbi:hypothetical protein ON010_g1662 [Phytophthora cinnamomi]|nr:hypothetical protein ON010_g1662 [Phytophthora cinnamomi]